MVFEKIMLSSAVDSNSIDASNYANIMNYLKQQQARQPAAADIITYLEEKTKQPAASERFRIISSGKVLRDGVGFHVHTLLELVSEDIVDEDTPYLDWIFSVRDEAVFSKLEPFEKKSKWQRLIRFLNLVVVAVIVFPILTYHSVSRHHELLCMCVLC
jgi:hypothetical protein